MKNLTLIHGEQSFRALFETMEVSDQAGNYPVRSISKAMEKISEHALIREPIYVDGILILGYMR